MNETKNKTIFEKIVDREIPADILYEDDENIAFLDIAPFEKGHILVIPKKAYETVWEMPEDEYLQLQKIVLKFTKKMRVEMNCGINIAQNNLKIADQEVPHVHFHIVPRSNDKREFYKNTKNGEKYIDNEDKKTFTDKLKID